MKTRKINSHRLFSGLRVLINRDPWTVLIVAVSFLVVILIILVSTQFGALFTVVRSSDFKAGEVAEKDFVVERDILYADQEATRLKQEAAEKLVLPIFRVNEEITQRSLALFDQFQESFNQLILDETPLDTVYLKIQLTFPGIMTREGLAGLFSFPLLENLFQQTGSILEEIFQVGIISLPEKSRELISAGAIEVWRWRDGKLEKEEYPLERVVTLETIEDWIAERIAGFPEESAALITSLVKDFAVENGFLDMEQTTKRRQWARKMVESVMAKLAAGQMIIRKGDIVTEVEAAQIKAVGDYSASVNLINIAGTIIFVGIIFSFSLYVLNKRILKVKTRQPQVIFLAASGLFYILYAAVFSKFFKPPEGLPFAVILPTAAIAILVTLIISANVGFIFSIILSLLVLSIIRLDIYSFLFAVLTGIAGTAVVFNAEKRIDLIRAGVLLSLWNFIIISVLNLLGNYQPRWFLQALGWGILNGFLSSLVGSITAKGRPSRCPDPKTDAVPGAGHLQPLYQCSQPG